MRRTPSAHSRIAKVIALVAAVALSLPLVPAAAATEAAPPAGDAAGRAAAVPVDRAAAVSTSIAWADCPTTPTDHMLAGFECATVVVPLDYAEPGGRTITLGVVRHPARTPAERLGTVMFNPGGPGDQGSAFLPALLGGFPAEVLDRFDLVSWDPRGMGGMSTPVVQCYDSQAEEEKVIAAVDFPPLSRTERTRWAAIHARVNQHCGGRDDALLRHVSTADSARDMDRLRQLMGEERVWYYGTSYGTFLGATYQNMFPDHVVSMVLDGTVDPVPWVRPQGILNTFLRVGSDVASARTLQSFLTLCGKTSRTHCAFSAGSPAKTRTKYLTLLSRARAGNVRIPGTGAISESSIVTLTTGNLYLIDPAPGLSQFVGWSALADTLQQLSQASTGPGRSRGAEGAVRAATVRAATAQPYKGVAPQLSVICGESPNPVRPAAYVQASYRSTQRSGVGGALWPFVAYCARWPVRAAHPYLGPWTNGTAPMVVIGVTGDPATPYGNAVAAARLMGGHLVTVKGYGHTELANPSSCAQAIVADLFVRGQEPTGEPVCRQDQVPFA